MDCRSGEVLPAASRVLQQRQIALSIGLRIVDNNHVLQKSTGAYVVRRDYHGALRSAGVTQECCEALRRGTHPEHQRHWR